ncbi:hypothetical protein C8J56DRAFT_1060575 [Mycena floridula]|nr:hypothetical protein C8J56DRAFT_1060575 [Mycena floridula]
MSGHSSGSDNESVTASHDLVSSNPDYPLSPSQVTFFHNTAHAFTQILVTYLTLEQAGFTRPVDLFACVCDANPSLIAYVQHLNRLGLYDCIKAITDLSLRVPPGTEYWENDDDLPAVHIAMFTPLLQHTATLPSTHDSSLDPPSLLQLLPDAYLATNAPPSSS